MNYSFYLFVKLRDAVLGEGAEYDLQYGIDQQLFSIYDKSEYNEENTPEYECIVNFLQAYKDNKIALISDQNNKLLSKNDWVVLIDTEAIEHEHITPRKGDVLQFIRVNDNDINIGEFLHLPTNQPLNIFADRTLKLNK